MATDKRVLNKVALITGSSSGIGRAIALLYAQHGAKVVCADLRPDARSQMSSERDTNTHDLIKQNGGESHFCTTDVVDSKQVQNAIAETVANFGRLDIMVNNAGIAIESGAPLPIQDTAEETWDKTLAINGRSVFLGCKYAVTQMLKQEPHESGDRGWIINLSSIYGLVGAPGAVSYSASKGAVANLTRALAVEQGPNRIHVNAINPGHIQTAIFEDMSQSSRDIVIEKHPWGRFGEPSEIARIALVLASEDAAWMTGANVSVDGGFVAQ